MPVSTVVKLYHQDELVEAKSFTKTRLLHKHLDDLGVPKVAYNGYPNRAVQVTTSIRVEWETTSV